MYLKRHASPQRWKIARKHGVFITRPSTTGHRLRESIALASILTDMLHLTQNAREALFVVRYEQILINGHRIRRADYPVGLLDILTIPKLGKYYLMGLTSNDVLALIPIPESETHTRICMVRRKVQRSTDQIQLTTNDGTTRLIARTEPVHVGDSIIVDNQTNQIVRHLPRVPGATVQTISHGRSWQQAVIERIDRSTGHVYFCDGSSTVLDAVIVVPEGFLNE